MNHISLEHLRQLAYNAHSNTSFSPERRADSIVKDYTKELNEDLKIIEGATPAGLPEDEGEAILSRYANKYESLLKSWLYSHSNVASSFIVGPSNFPGARMQKRSQWADNHYNHFRVWRTRALKAILKGLKPKIDELTQAQAKLNQRIRLQRLMVTTNKIIRKGGPTVKEQLSALGFSSGEIVRLLTPDWAKRTGFVTFQLSNNNAEIHRLQKRVQLLEEKKNKAETTGAVSEEIKGVRLVQNYEDDRVQLFFDGKPTPEIIKSLHANGFKWKPSVKAWQRFLNPQSISIARNFLEKL